jgi:rhamnosyltransferase
MSGKRFIRAELAIGLVLYHPEEYLLKRVDQIVAQGFRLYVFDNSPFGPQCSRAIQENPKIFYLTAGKNVGIGYSLSTLCATAYAHGYTRLLFLDQDTGISVKTLEFIISFSQSLPTEIEVQYVALVFSGYKSSDHSIQEVNLAISSGSLFNLSVLKQIGWHNEKYFVDCVDYELCVRARRCGYKIGLVRNTPDFDHISEQPDQVLKFFGKELLVRSYPISRINDALSAYLKIIVFGLFKNRTIDTYALTRSMVMYIFGQLASRLIQSRKP